MAARESIRTIDAEEAHRIQSAMLKDYVGGTLDDYNFLFRACVIEVDHVGGILSGPDSEFRDDEPPNPKNSIVARVLTHDFHKKTEELTVFWPLFSHDVMPIKPGEHVYVLFEDTDEQQHGLWLTRIPEPLNVANANYVTGIKKYEEDSDSNKDVSDFNKAVCDVPDTPETTEPPEEFTVEEGQPFTARVGDRCSEGSNNTMIVQGRDRPTDVESGEKEGSGTIDIVAGRQDPENMNQDTDLSRVYVSMLSEPDANCPAIQESFGNVEDGEVPEADGPLPSILQRTTAYRLCARESIKIVVDGKFGISVNADGKVQIEAADACTLNVGKSLKIVATDEVEITGKKDSFIKADGKKLVCEGKNVKVGSDSAAEPLVLGDKLATEWKIFLDAIKAGPIGDLAGIPVITHPALIAAIEAFKPKLMKGQILSSNHTTED